MEKTWMLIAISSTVTACVTIPSRAIETGPKYLLIEHDRGWLCYAG
jgi:hypothetical protein